MSIAVVITTIQNPTPGVRAIVEGMATRDGEVFLIGDRKTPPEFGMPSATAVSIENQSQLAFATAKAVPENSYTRKMIGYLLAMESGHTWIRETDDDNNPYESFFDDVPNSIEVRRPETADWINPYAYFTDRFIWPRGFPLDAVHPGRKAEVAGTKVLTECFLLQGLADGDPDVDAVYRLTTPNPEPVAFDDEMPLLVPGGSWAPFNSQVTTWPKELFPLMYLPATCSFRMTDIWRSFVAQRLMRERSAHLVFTAPTVFQDRNTHDLMRDFRDEVEGYLGYRNFVEILDGVSGLDSRTLSDGLREIYAALVTAGFFTVAELTLLDAWLTDIAALGMDYA